MHRVRNMLAAITLAAVCACGRSANEPTDTLAVRDKPSITRNAVPGTIRIAARRLPQAAADPSAHIGQPAIYIWPAFFDALTFIRGDGQIVPWLAVDWTNTSDTSWQFTLREGVRFSNDEPFNAEAVQAAADNILFGYGANNLVRNTLLPNVTAVNVVDERTVEFVTDEPDPLLPRRLAQFYPLPPKYFAEVGPERFALHPVGTGPFYVESWDVNRVVLRANERSWRPPRVDTLEFIEMPDGTARRQAILSGQVEIAQHLAPDDIPDLERAGIAVSIAPEPRVRIIGFVARRGSPLESKQVRLALNHAVNKKAIVKALTNGVSPVATHVATQTTAGFSDSRQPYQYSLEHARQLLADAGYEDGLDFRMEVVAPTHTDRLVFEAVAADLADAGVNVEVRVIEFEQWRQELFSGEWKGDLFSWSVALDPVLDITRPFPYLSCDHPNPPFCDREVTDLVNNLAFEFDEAARDEQLQRVFDLMQENPPGILLYEMVQVDGILGVGGFEIHNLIVLWDRLYLE